jgi:rod shape-determining protein MreC
MDLILNRYRNLTVLLAAILTQLVLLAYQVKSNQEVRLIRVWAVTAVTPVARVLESGRSSTVAFFRDYFVLLDVRDENKHLKSDLNRFQLENQRLRADLSTADRASALAIFQAQSPMKFLAAHIIGNTTDSSAKAVLIDLGAPKIQKGMAVITPDGIVGKVTSVYPTASYVLLITDPAFAAGVISQKNRVHGILKGQGSSTVIVEDVQNEENVEPGDAFYTSGDDGIFPKGLPAGTVVAARSGRGHKEISLTPAGFQNGLEEVFVIVEGVHLPIPNLPAVSQSVFIQPPPAVEGDASSVKAPSSPSGASTDLDRLHEHYKNVSAKQKHEMGERGTGAPNFNLPEDSSAPKPNSKGPALPKPQAPAESLPATQRP